MHDLDPATQPVGRSGSARPVGVLRREVSLPVLERYGLGTTVGAGIHALTGEVAGEARLRAPLAFLTSAAAAGLTAIGFAELAGRLPFAAGEAVFVDYALPRARLSGLDGLTWTPWPRRPATPGSPSPEPSS